MHEGPRGRIALAAKIPDDAIVRDFFLGQRTVATSTLRKGDKFTEELLCPFPH
jgi:hypothetical protein